MCDEQKSSAALGRLEKTFYNHGLGHTQTISDLCFASAEGDFIFDTDGKRYVDFNGALNLPFGHDWSGVRTILEQPLSLNAVSYATRERLELCETLKRLFPHYTAFQFYSAGTEANEGAIRYAIAITGKDGFMSFQGSYHGRTRATVSLCNMKTYNGTRLPGYFRVPFPASPEGAEVALAELDRLAQSESACGGIFIEPVQGKTVIVPPEGFLHRLKKEICEKYGLLLIADEYLTSMRTGVFSFSIAQGVEPDIMTIGKCLGNGIPFAVLLCHEKHAEQVWRVKGSTTFGGNPLACKVASVNLGRIQTENLLSRTTDVLQTAFFEEAKVLSDCRMVTGVRGIGALLGIELVDKPTCLAIGQRCLAEGILVSCIGQVIRITPSFTISEELFRENVREICRRVLVEAACHG